jgi:5-methyltetrahydrofolate--homocysteine methyltransferase
MSILEQMAADLMKGKANDVKAAVEQALADGMEPGTILNEGLLSGMSVIGARFKRNEVYVPEVLIAARAMKAGMEVLQPRLVSAGVEPKGTAVIGTVKGDLHDIGKNLLAMMVEGAGWKVVDLGVDVGFDKYEKALEENNAKIMGMSALLTTTMVNMKGITEKIKAKNPETIVMVGGAPLTQNFCDEIGANFYAPDPQLAIEYLNSTVA